MAPEDWERILEEFRDDQLMHQVDAAEAADVKRCRSAVAAKSARDRFNEMFRILQDRLPRLPALSAAKGVGLIHVQPPDGIGNRRHGDHHDDLFEFRIRQTDLVCRMCRESATVSASIASPPNEVIRTWPLDDPDRVFEGCLRLGLR